MKFFDVSASEVSFKRNKENGRGGAFLAIHSASYSDFRKSFFVRVPLKSHLIQFISKDGTSASNATVYMLKSQHIDFSECPLLRLSPHFKSSVVMRCHLALCLLPTVRGQLALIAVILHVRLLRFSHPS